MMKFNKMMEKTWSLLFDLLDRTGMRKNKAIAAVLSNTSYLLSLILKTEWYIEIDEQKLWCCFYPGRLFSRKHMLYYPKSYEPYTTRLFCSMLEEGMTVIDVGASLGYYTLLATKRVGDSGLVLAFEPNPVRFNGLEKNIRGNNWNNVRAFQFAVSDSNEKVKAYTFNGSFIIANAIFLNDFLDDISIDPSDIDIVKIDVDGGELKVLKGIKKILDSGGKAKIICEVTPSSASPFGYNESEILDILSRYGYSAYLIDKKGLIPITSFVSEAKNYLFTTEVIK